MHPFDSTTIENEGEKSVLIKRSSLIIMTVITMLSVMQMTKNPFVIWGVTILVVMTIYIAIVVQRNGSIMKLLDETCDPEAFLEATLKQRKIIRDNKKISAYLYINEAAALINLGRNEEALKILESIDKTKLGRSNGPKMIYELNRMICLYELGDIQQAEENFEKVVPLMTPKTNREKLIMQVFLADRKYYLGQHDAYLEAVQPLEKEKLSTRSRLGILFRKGCIEEANGNMELAKKYYIEVAERGNKLGIAVEARGKVGEDYVNIISS